MHIHVCSSVTSSLKFADRSIAIAAVSPLFGTNSHQHFDNYLIHYTNSPKPHPLQSLHSSFSPNLKHCSSTNTDPIVIVIVISKLLKRYSKAKRTRAPAYSRALRRIKGGFQRGVKRSSGPNSRVPGVDRV